MSIYKLLVGLSFPAQGLQALPAAENPLDHVSLLKAHFCRYQENWVRSVTLAVSRWLWLVRRQWWQLTVQHPLLQPLPHLQQ